MNELIALLAATIISFWGSLQLGPVNVCVIETALAHGKRQALMVAAGGIIPELIYSAIAVAGSNLITGNPVLMNIFGWLLIAVLLGLGFYNIFKKYKANVIKASAGAGFLKGFFLAILNPQLLPFWLGILVLLKGYINFDQGTLFSPYFAFIVGTALGAWLLLYMFTRLAIAYKTKLESLLKNNMNKVVGCLFIALALIELARKLFWS